MMLFLKQCVETGLITAAKVWNIAFLQHSDHMGMHGDGPEGIFDYIVIWIGLIIVLITLVLSIKFLVKPNEDDPNHIKNIVKNEGF